MSAACFSGWGIRTLARTAVRYNPISYHNGSVWPHDNALIALGFARYGLKEPVVRVFAGLFDAACHWEPRRFPELFCGFARRGTAPTMYPVACSPQAWSSAAVFGLLQASLGLALDPAAGEIRFDRPTLPAFLRDLNLRGLRFDDAAADVLLQRHGGEVTAIGNPSPRYDARCRYSLTTAHDPLSAPPKDNSPGSGCRPHRQVEGSAMVWSADLRQNRPSGRAAPITGRCGLS